jgi:hypothetical protein
VTSAAAIVFEIGNVRVSTILTDPPDKGVLDTFENSNPKACGDCPLGLSGAVALSDGGAISTSHQYKGENVQI